MDQISRARLDYESDESAADRYQVEYVMSERFRVKYCNNLEMLR